MKKIFTLLQLQQGIRRKLQEIGQQAIWITAEIAEVKYITHCYLELVQKDNELSPEIVAKVRAVIWANQLLVIKSILGDDLPKLLQQGMKILAQVTVNYHEVYGLTLVVTTIDATYTLGELELQKQQTLQYLQTNQLLEVQKKLSLPIAIKHIAVISSAEAAGYGDFINQIQKNSLGYTFKIQLFQVVVQGEKSVVEIVTQLRQLAESMHTSHRFDCVVIIRGGGSRLDLEAFNQLAIALAIVHCPLPVLTGIGHQKDQTIADMVSHESCKTPTAVADLILDHNRQYETQFSHAYQRIQQLAQRSLQAEKHQLRSLHVHCAQLIKYRLKEQLQRLEHLQQNLQQNSLFFIQKKHKDLEILQKKISLLQPKTVMEKGYSITFVNGQPITASTILQKGDIVTTQTQFFTFESYV